MSAATSRAPARVRRRRRLMLISAPVAVLLTLAGAKMLSVAVAGDAAVADFARGDGQALAADAATLGIANLIEPAKAPFAAGTAAALQGRLEEADRALGEALARTPAAHSCPVRRNLQLVRESQGDAAAGSGSAAAAEQRYRAALQVVNDAPAHCFSGNSDPDPQRRAFREDTAARLVAKIDALRAPPPPAADAAPPPPPPPPPLAVVAAGPADAPSAAGRDEQGRLSAVAPDLLPAVGPVPPVPRRLERGGDPRAGLGRLLSDAASTGAAS